MALSATEKVLAVCLAATWGYLIFDSVRTATQFRHVNDQFDRHHTFDSGDTGDDQPIIVAGGSLEIGTEAMFWRAGTGGITGATGAPGITGVTGDLFPVPGATGRYVAGYDVSYVDGSGLDTDDSQRFSGQPVNVAVTYCKANGGGKDCQDKNGKGDEISIRTANSDGTDIRVNNRNGDLAQHARVLPNLITHRRRDWKIQQIQVKVGVTGPTMMYPCVPTGAPTGPKASSMGECSLTIHYCTLPTGSGCVFH